MANGVFFSNLPFGINENSLREQIKDVFKIDAANLQVKIYKPIPKNSTLGKPGQRAVVSGFNITFQQLEFLAHGKKIFGRDVCIKKDYGEERDCYGIFVEKMTSKEKRNFLQLTGCHNKKTLMIFDDNFIKQFDSRVINFNTPAAFLNAKKVDTSILALPGRIEKIYEVKTCGVIRIQYSTQLELMQAVRYLNNKSVNCGTKLQFCDSTGVLNLKLEDLNGLGAGGSLIRIKDTLDSRGFIPLDLFDNTILKHEKISFLQSRVPCCWNCKTEYTIVGLDASLNHIAAVCGCKYDGALPVIHPERAVMCQSEHFTRLIVGRYDTSIPKKLNFVVGYEPLKQIFTSKTEFRDISFPIVKEEWQFLSSDFSAKYTTSGDMISSNLVETIVSEETGLPNHKYVICVAVKLDKFWNMEKCIHCNKVTVIFSCFREKEHGTHTSKGRIRKFDEDCVAKTLSLYVYVGLPDGCFPKLNTQAVIIPKPKKAEYVGFKRKVNNWLRSETLPLIFMQNYNFASNPPCATFTMGRKTFCLHRLVGSLNLSQQKALKEAVESQFTIIQGPPGTGKTFLGSVISTYLSLLEKKVVLILTPSNFAADGISKKLKEVLKSHDVYKRILRVESHTREDYLKNPYSDNKEVFRYKKLHIEVKRSPKWLQGLDQITDKINSGRAHLLTQKELTTLEAHIHSIEVEILNQFNFLVCTIGTLLDTRVEKWNQDNKIETVIIDEAGQVNLPSAFPIMLLKAKRLILLGDHKQLSPHVSSYAAEVAGLGVSIMEWVYRSPHRIPWSLLDEQYRMHPTICDIVSMVSYDGRLKTNTETIQQRAIPSIISQIIWPFKKSNVVCFSHTHFESQVGNSYLNEWEINENIKIISHLIENHLDLSKFTVLTLYEAQKEAMKTKCKQTFGAKAEKMEIVNVDAFQGRENDFIFLHLVRSNANKAIGFASNINRINVGISRAKFGLVLFGNFDVFNSHQNQGWLKLMKELNKNAIFIKGQ